MGLIPEDVLEQVREDVELQFDTVVRIYRTVGPADIHGEAPEEEFTLAPARVVQRIEEFFDKQGQRQVSAMRIYLPIQTEIGMTDRIVIEGGSIKRTPPILEISHIPTVADPLTLRVRTGAA